MPAFFSPANSTVPDNLRPLAMGVIIKRRSAEATGLEEIEINPLLCTPNDAVAADALMRRKDILK